MSTTARRSVSKRSVASSRTRPSGATPERAQELGRERARLTARARGARSHRPQAAATPRSCSSSPSSRAMSPPRATSSAMPARWKPSVRQLEFKRMFRGEMDAHNAFLDIQAGAGGTEAQDWAQMLLRMYLRWGAARGFSCEVIDSESRRGRGHQERDACSSRATTPTAGCAPRPACTAWCASPRSTRATAAIPPLPRCSSRRRSTTTSTSRSIRPT